MDVEKRVDIPNESSPEIMSGKLVRVIREPDFKEMLEEVVSFTTAARKRVSATLNEYLLTKITAEEYLNGGFYSKFCAMAEDLVTEVATHVDYRKDVEINLINHSGGVIIDMTNNVLLNVPIDGSAEYIEEAVPGSLKQLCNQ